MAKKKENGSAMSNFRQALRELVNGEEPKNEEAGLVAEAVARVADEPAPPQAEPDPGGEFEPGGEAEFGRDFDSGEDFEPAVAPAPVYEEPTPEELQALHKEMIEAVEREAAEKAEKEAAAEAAEQLHRTEEEEQMPYEENGVYPQNYGGDTNMRSRTVIAEDVEIIGDIRARGDVDIHGNVEGNVMSEGHVTVAGAISGSVIAASADFVSGTLSGEAIQIQSHIDVKDGVEIVGEIQASSMEVNGSIQGNITVEDQIVLNAGAVISGDITAQYISIQKGAILNGKLSINQRPPEEYMEPAEALEPEAAPAAGLEGQQPVPEQMAPQQQPEAPIPEQPEGQE